MTKDKLIEGKVLQVIDDYKVVINKGKRDGVSLYQKFLIFYYNSFIWNNSAFILEWKIFVLKDSNKEWKIKFTSF